MSETSSPQTSRPSIPEELYWVSYLREDIQDLRQDVRGEIQSVRGEIQGLRQEFRSEIQGVRQEFRDEFRVVHGRIDELGKTLSSRLDSRFALLMTTMIGVAGVIIAVIKF